MKLKLTITLFFIAFSLVTHSQTVKNIDQVAPFSEDLAAIRKGDQWGFINKEGTLVIDFRDDLVWDKNVDDSKFGQLSRPHPLFENGMCLIYSTGEEGIPMYGFIDTTGKIAIEPEYLNITSFDNGLALGILCTKTFKGQNEFKLNIFEYKFSEVLIDTKGEIMEFIGRRDNILMTPRRYEQPNLRSKMLSGDLLAVWSKEKKWEVRKLEL
ncbi:WG repeat-containing protein [Poritiphilus flavus]|uniref:WG repeat-containing protein n=1 Tax=Poritiphilus flavus TaxID=2697053 RepID=A0A6L9EB02_9FLAO|nr:WG repeat-containing protein [Poritiphilus flavus]NAS11916.1 WG repeat-containing protein [Poritiphilus flavus]